MAVLFMNGSYIFNHEHAPRGRGKWAFTVRGEHENVSPEQMIEKINGRTYTTFFVPEVCLYSEAKKKAIEMLKAKGITPNVLIVAP